MHLHLHMHMHMHMHMHISHRMTIPAHGSIKAWQMTTPEAAFGLRDQVGTWDSPHNHAAWPMPTKR
jgi:hypothetical protein